MYHTCWSIINTFGAEIFPQKCGCILYTGNQNFLKVVGVGVVCTIYVASILYNLARLDTLPYVTLEVTDGNGQFDAGSD